jgi:TolA-binding protein
MRYLLKRLRSSAPAALSGGRVFFGLVLAASLVMALTPAQTEDLVKRYYALDAVLNGKDYRKAAQLYQGLVDDYGRSEFGDELRFGLAEAWFNLGEYTRARSEFEAVVEHPRYEYIEPEALYGYAISSIMIGNYQEADAALQRLVKKQGYENDPRTNFAFGVLRYFRKEYDAAINRLKDDSLLEATFFLGKSLGRVGKPHEALLAFKRITSSAPGTPLATLAHFAAGEAMFINGDFEGARAKFRFFLDDFPDSPLIDYAHYFYGCALIHGQQYEDAINELLPLTRHSNNFLAAHANYFVGYCNLESGRARDAVVRFQKVRANFPKTRIASYANLQLTQALLAAGDTTQTLLSTGQLSIMFTTGELQAVGDYLSGVLTLQLGQSARSANFFENILIRYPQSPLREPACALLLQALNAAGSFDRATTVGSKYVKDFPDTAIAWRGKLLYFLAEAYYYLRRFTESEDFYRRAFEIPLSLDIAPYARLGRAFSLMQLDRNDEALLSLRSLASAKPSDTAFTAVAVVGLGYAFFNKGEYDTARVHFEFVTEHFPEVTATAASAYFYAGLCYRKLGYPGDAIDAWSAVVNKYPDDPKAAEAGFRAGETYFRSGEYEKAISLFRFVTEHYPFSNFGPLAQAFVGQCYYNQRMYKDAIREHQKFIDLYPADDQAQSVRKSLEMDYYRAGMEDSTYMDAFVKRYPESELVAQARFDHALSMMQAKDFAGAAMEFQTVVVNFPGSSFAPKSQLNAGECYATLESWQQAIDAYQKYLDYFPSGTDRDAALFNLGISDFKLGKYQEASQAFQTIIRSFPNSQYAEGARKNAEISQKRLGTGKEDK